MDGPGPGFHAHSDDNLLGHVLHGIGSENNENCVCREGSGTQKKAEIIFLQKKVALLCRDSEKSYNIAPQTIRETI